MLNDLLGLLISTANACFQWIAFNQERRWLCHFLSRRDAHNVVSEQAWWAFWPALMLVYCGRRISLRRMNTWTQVQNGWKSIRKVRIWAALTRSPETTILGFENLGYIVATWLILPVVIRSSQRLSHACVSIRYFIETADGSLYQL